VDLANTTVLHYHDNTPPPPNTHKADNYVRGQMRGSAAPRLLGLKVRIPPGAWGFVSFCIGLITRPEVSYRQRGVSTIVKP
jgi:hypothetical protein